MDTKVKFTKVGEALKSKAGNTYIKITSDVALKAGQQIGLFDPRASVNKRLERGSINAEDAAAALAKIQNFHVYDLVVSE